jgi:hypothetical protein
MTRAVLATAIGILACIAFVAAHKALGLGMVHPVSDLPIAD